MPYPAGHSLTSPYTDVYTAALSQAIPSRVAGSSSKPVALTRETGRAVERQEVALGVQVKGWSLLTASGW